jgi:acetyl esterase/lipase
MHDLSTFWGFLGNPWVPAGVDLHDPRISPSHMDMGKFPSKVLAFACARDNLCEEVEVLLKKVEGRPGKVVKHFRLDRCDHAWDKSCKHCPRERKVRSLRNRDKVTHWKIGLIPVI